MRHISTLKTLNNVFIYFMNSLLCVFKCFQNIPCLLWKSYKFNWLSSYIFVSLNMHYQMSTRIQSDMTSEICMTKVKHLVFNYFLTQSGIFCSSLADRCDMRLEIDLTGVWTHDPWIIDQTFYHSVKHWIAELSWITREPARTLW